MNQDPRTIPNYGVTEASRYLHMAPATLRSWVRGRDYPREGGTAHFAPLISLPEPDSSRLSFENLVEAHVLRALRSDHGVSIQAVRAALDYASKEIGVDRLLLSRELQAGAGDLFLKQYGNLINLSRSGQMAMKYVLESYLARVERDSSHAPVRLFPFLVAGGSAASKSIVIDPFVAFGRPTLIKRGITTAAIAERIDAGESIHDIAADYGLTDAEVEEAVVYERAA